MKWEDFLKKTNVFKDLSSEEIHLVSGLAQERTYKANTKVLKEGESPTEFFVCIEGNLAIQIEVPGRGAITISTITNRHAFGWSALTTASLHYEASVITNKDSRVLVFDGLGLKKIFEDRHRIGYIVMQNLVNVVFSRLRDTRLGLASCIVDYGKR